MLLKKAHEGDKEARDTLIEENMGLVRSVAARFRNRGVDLEDLFQIGSIGLIKAVDKFDLTYQVQFSTYAVPMIAGEIKRFLRDDGMLKVSRTLKEIAIKAYGIREKMEKSRAILSTNQKIGRGIISFITVLFSLLLFLLHFYSFYRPPLFLREKTTTYH